MLDIDVIRRNNLVEMKAVPGKETVFEIAADLVAQRLVYNHHVKEFHRGVTNHLYTERRRLFHEEPGRLVLTYPSWRTVAGLLSGALLNFDDPVLDDEAFYKDHYAPDPQRLQDAMDRAGFKFRAGQSEMVDQWFSAECGLVRATGGVGKSTLIWLLCEYFSQANILVITKRASVVGQLVRDLTMSNFGKGDKPLLPKVHRIDGGKSYFEPLPLNRRWVAVSTADSAYKVLALEGSRVPHFVIGDEAHLMMEERYQRMLYRLSKEARMFALTASPRWRSDGADQRLHSIYGPRIVEITTKEAEDLGIVVPVDIRWAVCKSCDSDLEDERLIYSDVERERWAIWRNRPRNQIIGEIAHYHQDEQMLILVNKVDHIEHLREFLPGDFEVVVSEAAGLKRKAREALELDFRKGRKRAIVSTVWSEGMSFQALKYAVNATGDARRDLATQRVFRVNRTHDETGKTNGVYYDLWDAFHPKFKSAANARRKYYMEEGWAGADDLTESWRMRLSDTEVAAASGVFGRPKARRESQACLVS
jgi:superfamily II DNA or RNA helicase